LFAALPADCADDCKADNWHFNVLERLFISVFCFQEKSNLQSSVIGSDSSVGSKNDQEKLSANEGNQIQPNENIIDADLSDKEKISEKV